MHAAAGEGGSGGAQWVWLIVDGGWVCCAALLRRARREGETAAEWERKRACCAGFVPVIVLSDWGYAQQGQGENWAGGMLEDCIGLLGLWQLPVDHELAPAPSGAHRFPLVLIIRLMPFLPPASPDAPLDAAHLQQHQSAILILEILDRVPPPQRTPDGPVLLNTLRRFVFDRGRPQYHTATKYMTPVFVPELIYQPIAAFAEKDIDIHDWL
eukprot:gene40922-50024_t